MLCYTRGTNVMMKHNLVMKVALVIVAAYVVLNLLYDSVAPLRYLKPEHIMERQSCEKYKKLVQENIKVFDALHDSLVKYKIEHFLIYGSVWGPLRNYSGPLPWDHDIDLGIFAETYTDEKMANVARELKLHGIEMRNEMFYFGAWRVNKGSAHIDVSLHEKTLSYRHRKGFQMFIIPAHYFKMHFFPSKYVDTNMKKVRFGHRYVNLPNRDIVKYLYPDNWWLVKKPVYFNCSNVAGFYK